MHTKYPITTSYGDNIDLLPQYGNRVTIPNLAMSIAASYPIAKNWAKVLQNYHPKVGKYQSHGKAAIQEICQRIAIRYGATNLVNSNFINNVVAWLEVSSPYLWDIPTDGIINCLNGLLDWKGKKGLISHSSDFLSTIQIGVRYDPSKKCPTWERMLGQWISESSVVCIDELLAGIIDPHVAPIKTYIFPGPGANGKSTLLAILRKFAGEENISHLSIQMMIEQPFMLSQLVGKLANICGDLPNRTLLDTSIFKALTGGDMVMADIKFHDPMVFRNFSKQVMATNEMPSTKDVTQGLMRRLHPVPFPNTFKENSRVRDQIIADCTSPDELSGMLNRALAVLPKLRRDGFTVTNEIKEYVENYEARCNPVVDWVAKHVVKTRRGDDFLYTEEMYEKYLSDTVSNSEVQLTMKQFGRLLPNTLAMEPQKRGGSMGYRGIAWR
jgi:putative DNA primase/helicase